MKTITLSLLTSLLMAVPAFAVKEGTYTIDQSHSNVGFEISHMGISLVVGRFNNFQGTVKFIPNGDTKINVSIETTSIDTNSDKRDRHLRAGDFFNVERFPKMTFESQTITYFADGNIKEIQGRLTLLSQTRPVVLTVTPIGEGRGPLGDIRVGLKASTLIKRSDFGMNALAAVVGEEVQIQLNVEAIKE